MGPCLVTLLLMASPPVEPGLGAALAREAAGDDAGAEALLEQVSRAHPSWDLPHREAGRLLLKDGRDLGLAQYHLDIARSLAPENAESHALFGMLQLERGAPAVAAASLQVASALRPEDADLHYRLGQVHEQLGQWADAERSYLAAKALRPAWSAARLRLALVRERLGRRDEGAEELRALCREHPDFVPARRELAALEERGLQGSGTVRRALRPLPKSRR